MMRIAMIALAGVLGVAVLVTGLMDQRDVPAETAFAEAVDTADIDGAAARMRVCLGPARVTFGGEPFLGLAFGGDGCSANANLVGFRILRGPTLPPGPTLTLALPPRL